MRPDSAEQEANNTRLDEEGLNAFNDAARLFGLSPSPEEAAELAALVQSRRSDLIALRALDLGQLDLPAFIWADLTR